MNQDKREKTGTKKAFYVRYKIRYIVYAVWMTGAVLLGIVVVAYLALDTGPSFDSNPDDPPVNSAQTIKNTVDVAVAATVTAMSADAPTPSPTFVPRQIVAAPVPTRAPSWSRVPGWKGSSIKDTETFNIASDEWRIRWETSSGQTGFTLFQVYVYSASSELKSVAANVAAKGGDVSYMRGSGRYYLSIINTTQPYSIVVEQR